MEEPIDTGDPKIQQAFQAWLEMVRSRFPEWFN